MEDLVLGTVGVVMLLLVLALAQIGVPEVSKDRLEAMASELAAAMGARDAAEKAAAQERAARAAADGRNSALEGELEGTKRELAGAQDARDAARRDAARSKELAAQNQKRADELKSALDPKPVSVVLVCDGTLSMGPVLLALRKAALSLADLGGWLSPRFALGIVVYRSKGNEQSFPLTEIAKSSGDRESTGKRALRRFMEDKVRRVGVSTFAPGAEKGTSTGEFDMVAHMDPLSGYADVEGGVRAGLAMLSKTPASERTVLILCGDVGTHEGGDPERIDPGDRESEARICREVASFAASHPNARVWSVFAGKDVENLKFPQQSAAFFRNVAVAAGKRGTYSDDLSSLAGATVEAVFKPNGAQ